MIYQLNKIPDNVIELAGGKAKSLNYMLTHTRIRIPEGYVLLAGDSISRSDIDRLDNKYTYAVRSSAINEDGDNESFAGQYETITDVRVEDVEAAINKVLESAGSERIKAYSDSRDGVAVVIERFVKPEFAGVVFTSDVITGKDDKLIGNFVKGEGEQLVSGESNAEVFTIDAISLEYKGNSELTKYAKILGKYCNEIRRLYKKPMDIEWAVSEGKVYILQARPITTLKRLDIRNYKINGTRSGYKLLTKTNVGEIFMKPISPMTFSVLEKINGMLGLPDWLDNICGQAYMNISVMCSIQAAFGISGEKAFNNVKSLAGAIPDDLEVPLSPFDKKEFYKTIKVLLFPKEKCKLSKKQKHEMVRKLPDISRQMIDKIRTIKDNGALLSYWEEQMLPSVKDGLASILAESGTKLVTLFKAKPYIQKITGDRMADRLLGGCLGIVESMKPMLLLEDVKAGRLSAEEYKRQCGHRCPDEMELMAPRPYEDPNFPNDLIRMSSDADLYAMLDTQNKAYEEALEECGRLYPNKIKAIRKMIDKYARANAFREEIRSKGVYVFCVFREFILKAGELNGLGDDVFMLMIDELFDGLRGDKAKWAYIADRKASYAEYLDYPPFPNVVMGRFDPQVWIDTPGRRSDFYCADLTASAAEGADIRGFAGAEGKVRGTVRVITDIDRIGEIEEGDILVTTATNIGWTPVFSKVAAIVTDIGAPLSHAAIVAREFGIPAVVGCGNATMLLKTGDRVEVDGASGTVVKLEQ